MKKIEIGYMDIPPSFTFSDQKNQSTPVSYYFIDAEGIESNPPIEYQTEENPNGGQYVAISTGRKPSFSFTVKFQIIGNPNELFKAQNSLNYLTAYHQLLRVFIDEDFGNGKYARTTVVNCRITGEILIRISGRILEGQITFTANPGSKTISAFL